MGFSKKNSYTGYMDKRFRPKRLSPGFVPKNLSKADRWFVVYKHFLNQMQTTVSIFCFDAEAALKIKIAVFKRKW
jgi:hypothetical protein